MYQRLLAHGFAVWWLSQPRPSKVTSGLPDLLAFHDGRRLTLWIEAKHPDAPAPWTAEQQAFAAHCAATGVPYLLGGEAVLVAWLGAQGIATPPLAPEGAAG
jgi:hypothetical protein